MYPNPFITSLTIDSPREIARVVVTSITGEVVMTSTQQQLHLSHLISGVYFVRVEFVDQGVQVVKVMKK